VTSRTTGSSTSNTNAGCARTAWLEIPTSWFGDFTGAARLTEPAPVTVDLGALLS
jgi:hypothetical protein